MKTQKILILFSFLVILTSGFTQQSLSAIVIAEFQYNPNNNVYFLYVSSNSEYYKSVVTEVEINTNDQVTIWIPANQDSLFLVTTRNNQKFFVEKISNPSNQLPQEISLLLPSIENDILFFDNKDHLTELYVLTQDYINTLEDDDSTQKYLDVIEKLYGENYISFRSHFNNKYPVDSTYTDTLIYQMNRENFISDDVLNTYLNNFRLIGIGDTVYYYNNRKEILAVEKENYRGIDFLKEIARLKDMTVEFDILKEISSKTLESKNVVYISKKGKKGIAKGLVYTANPLYDDYYFQTIPDKFDEVEDCNPYKKGIDVEVWYGTVAQNSSNKNYYTDLFQSTQQADISRTVKLIINWGDNSPLQTVNNYTDLQDIYHTYPNGVNATYNVTIETQLIDLFTGQVISIFDGQGYPSSVQIKFIIGTACTGEDTQDWKTKVSSNGNWKMETSGWINNNIISSNIGGYTHAYQKQNNGSWKRDKAKIKVEVEGVFRHNNDCENTEFKSGNKEHSNDKKIQEIKTKLFTRYKKFANGDVKTNHRLIKGNITLQQQIILNPCE